MTENPTSDPDMRDLMAAVGHVLLSWGYLEAAICDRVLEIDPELKSSTTPLRSRWRAVEPSTPEFEALYAEIVPLADIRHCLAHCLSSANADPAAGKEPEVVCRTPEGDRTFSLAALQGVSASLHRASFLVRGMALSPQNPGGRPKRKAAVKGRRYSNEI